MSQRLYYYFAPGDRRLRYGDGRDIVLGEAHTVDCEPVLCESGLHASRRALDSLVYAPGPVLYRVALGGTVVHGDDKSCATERTYVGGGVDVSDVLRDFARRCALDVVHLWDAPSVVVQYLETGDENLRAAAARVAAALAARTSARTAARVATEAAWAAAEAAARVAAEAAWAAWAAAEAAALGAAEAAWAAAWDARARQNRRLAQMLSMALR